jgi:hypothetical protein
MRRKRRPHRLSAGERADCGTRGRCCGEFVLSRRRGRFLKLQLQLVEQLAAALGGLPVLLAPQLGDQQFQVRHHRLGAAGARLRFLARRALGGQRRLQRGDLLGQVLGRAGHGPIVAQRQSRTAAQL